MRTIWLSSALLIGIASVGAAWATPTNFSLCFSDTDCIEIQRHGARIEAQTKAPQRSKVVFDHATGELLEKAANLITVSEAPLTIDSRAALMVVVRTPSAPGNAEGFCGAGFEDYLVLLSLDSNIIRLHDKQLLQSCLESISLVSDEGDDPRKALKPSKAPWLFTYASMSPPDFKIQQHNVRVENGKFLIE